MGSGAELFHRALVELGADLCLWWEAGTGLMWPLCFSGITWEHLREQSGGAAVLGVLRGPFLPVLQRGFLSPCLLGAVLGKLFCPRKRREVRVKAALISVYWGCAGGSTTASVPGKHT